MEDQKKCGGKNEMENEKAASKKPSLFNRWLNGIERVGNKLPHPIRMIVSFCFVLFLLMSAKCTLI